MQRFLDTSKEGEIVTDADLSHLSLMINDLPGIESKVVLSPGYKTGTTALSLKVKEDPLSAVMFLLIITVYIPQVITALTRC